MNWRTSVIAIAALAGASALAPGAASAMPNGLPNHETVSQVEQVRWVCNPWGRCWWRPNYFRPYAFYGRPFHRPWGWHRGWHRRW